MAEKAFMSWSGGKDSALALYRAQRNGIPVKALVTSVNATADRISMHGVRRILLKQQALATGLPLRTLELPEMPAMDTYETAVRSMHRGLKAEGFTHGVFGDIFLEDLKQYRENLLAQDELQGLFPLWKVGGNEVIRQFLEAGFKAIVVCVNNAFLDKGFCGRVMDETFFHDLPGNIDPCGENGEYHSFVFDGPLFSKPINFRVGEVVFREYKRPNTPGAAQPTAQTGFYFCDLLPL